MRLAAADLLPLAEVVVDETGQYQEFEELIGRGGRPRRLPVRTLQVGIVLTALLGLPLHLTRVYQVLCALPDGDRTRLGIRSRDKSGRAHDIKYRQIEYLFNRVIAHLDSSPVLRRRPGETVRSWRARLRAALPTTEDGAVRDQRLAMVSDRLLDATIPGSLRDHGHHAIDWTDVATWARFRGRSAPATDLNARLGRRPSRQPYTKNEYYFGYAEQIIIMVPAEEGPPVPELVRRIGFAPANAVHPMEALPILQRMVEAGIPPGDLLADSAYSYKKGWTLRVTALGYELVGDVHPNDRGPKGTEQGATICEGCFYCPAMPRDLLQIARPGPTTDKEKAARLIGLADSRRSYRLANKGRPDADGYRRYTCPATAGKVRCPLKPDSMALSLSKPMIIQPPDFPPLCCTQHTITVSPEVANKTRQKHDYNTSRWHISYARRVAAERGVSTIKDWAGENLNRGSIRLVGRAKIWFMRAHAWAARNLRMLVAFDRRQAALQVNPPRQTRSRRRTRTYEVLVANLEPPAAPANGPPALD